MADPAVASLNQPDFRPIAPAWHTFVLLLALLTISGVGAYSHRAPGLGQAHGHAIGYVIVIASEWLLVAFVWFGVRRYRVRLIDLVGGSWSSWKAIGRDLGIAGGFLLVSNIVLALLGRLLHATPNQAIRNLLPQGGFEVALYLLLSLTAGICEEIIFRGYLQKQFVALTRSAAAALVLQGIVFGIAHGYQGPKYMFIIAVYGCLFGLLAQWRQSLRPGINAHFLQDGIFGIVARHFLK